MKFEVTDLKIKKNQYGTHLLGILPRHDNNNKFVKYGEFTKCIFKPISCYFQAIHPHIVVSSILPPIIIDRM